VLLLNGRLAFMPDKPAWLYPKDCILCLYGPFVEPGYEVWNWREPWQRQALKSPRFGPDLTPEHFAGLYVK
jgi:hypothetical protein